MIWQRHKTGGVKNMVYFIADPHFGHENVLRLCNRPFETIEQMNETLIQNWNRRVTGSDNIYIVGDLFFRCEDPEAILRRLHGKKQLIVGNHDSSWMGKVQVEKYFKSVELMAITSTGTHAVTLCHYPLLSWKHAKTSYMIHGHIHANTDIVVLSVFTDLKLVSVYSVYFLIVEHIQKFFKSFSHAFTPIIGKAISVKETLKANRYLDLYEFVVFNVSTVVFGCCIYLLPSFIMIYTHGVTDADYYRPVFSTIIVLAEYIYCVRDPYVSVIYAAGRFKETSLSAYIEAGINIVLSVSLVIWFGLEGIAVGTLIGMTYRMIYMIVFLKHHVIHRPVYKSLKRLAVSLAAMAASVGLMCLVDTTGSATLLLWVKNAVLSVLVFGAVTLILDLLFDRELTLWAFRSALKRNKQ